VSFLVDFVKPGFSSVMFVLQIFVFYELDYWLL